VKCFLKNKILVLTLDGEKHLFSSFLSKKSAFEHLKKLLEINQEKKKKYKEFEKEREKE
jgi:hypothetical protein